MGQKVICMSVNYILMRRKLSNTLCIKHCVGETCLLLSVTHIKDGGECFLNIH